MSASAPAAALRSLRRASPPTIGLIIGQVSSSFEIIYLARTYLEKNPEFAQESAPENENPSIENKFKSILNSDVWVADHAKHVTRMLPGGMFVLGIFIVHNEDVFNNAVVLGKLKSILSQINRILTSNKYMYGTPKNFNDRLIVQYSDGKVTCKSIDVEMISSASLKHVDINFKSNIKNWQQIDCYHQFDEIYPVVMKKTGMSVREQFQQILESAYQSIESSLVFLDGKLKTGSDTMESLNKRKKIKKNSKEADDEILSPIQASIFLPCESKMPNTVEYLECEGTTHFSGIVASVTYVNVKATVDDATTALKQDVMRSLASRFTMHCDALISDNLLPEEKVCFNEPPRRVLVKLPDLDGHIFFCDYLFPGESPEEAFTSVKEMLDANITEDDVLSNVETPADTSEFDALEKNPTTEEMLAAPINANRLFYVIAFSMSFVIGFIAIVMHYFIE